MKHPRTSTIVIVTVCALAPLLLGAQVDSAKLEPYPLPEWYANGIVTPKYVQDATAWLEKNPASQYAPRVAMDLLMAGTVGNDDALADRMRGVLLLQYPHSGPASYVLAQFPGPAEYAKFLLSLVRGHNEQPRDEKFAQRLDAAAVRGGAKWGGPQVFLAEPELAVWFVAAAPYLEDPRLIERIVRDLQKSRAGDAELMRVLAIAVEPALGAAEKVVALSDVEKDAARVVQGFLMTQLSEAERASPPVLKAAARELIGAYRPAEALKLLDAHPDRDKDPQLLFWRTWCHAAVGEGDKAAAVAQTAQRKFPQDPWARLSAQWAGHLPKLDETLAAHTAGLFEAIGPLRNGPTQLEARVTAGRHDGEGGPLSFYFAFAAGKAFDMHVSRGGEAVLAYRTTPTDSAAYFAGDAAVQRFRQPGQIPLPRLNLQKHPDGKLTFEIGFNTTASFEAAAAGFRSLATSPLLATKEAVLDLMKAGVARGMMPVAVQQRDGKRVFAWLSPRTREPRLERLELVVGTDGLLAGVRLETSARVIALESLNCGAAGAFEIKPPAWPKLAAVDRDRADAGMMFKMLGGVMNLFSGDLPPDTTQWYQGVWRPKPVE